ncbi:MAG: pilus assembly protein PilP [SAR86 cluster bacterium]|uniref:Pilus assembly protein PilP n=1 Tax=SAR86 cluster bacterium TaxID=2030880 RepID=A0A2A4XEW0_9GAMM|nr:MAG: pilus assembly protein PilP [SAR86 cluster bacterium]
MSLIKNITNDLRNFDWNDLQDVETIGIWPAPVKVIITLIIIVSCLAGGYFFHIQNLQTELQEVAGEEGSLRIEFEQKAFLAANLEEYRAQTVQMEESFTELLRQLPSFTEVPGLIEDVTQTGEGSGLEFDDLVLPEEEIQEFYIEIPMNLDVVGDFHDFGTFVSGVASLDRIVTLHDFSITARTDSFLDMSIVARTYRYKDVDEVVQ